MSYRTFDRLEGFRSTLTGLVRELRPDQWYKQLILFIPVVFSMRALDPTAWLRAGAGALLFSAVAGSVYVTNDIADVEEDRKDPTKRHRPIASGQVGVRTAAVTAVALTATSLVAAYRLAPLVALVLVTYVLQNLLYSTLFRDLLIVDLLVISTGFVLRALAGVWAIGSPISPWLLLATFLAALMLGTGKRWGELSRSDSPGETRATLELYSEEFLQFLLLSVSAMLLFAYSLYTFFAREIEMMLTIPFAFFAVFRYNFLTIEDHIDRPKEILSDAPMALNFLLWGFAVFVLLYVLPRVIGG